MCPSAQRRFVVYGIGQKMKEILELFYFSLFFLCFGQVLRNHSNYLSVFALTFAGMIE